MFRIASGKAITHKESYNSSVVLLIGHVFHPLDGFAVEMFLDGDVCHGGGG